MSSKQNHPKNLHSSSSPYLRQRYQTTKITDDWRRTSRCSTKNSKNYNSKSKSVRCGGIIFNDDGTKILLVRNRYLKDAKNIELWGCPKGHKKKSETYKECSEREIKEETGLNIKLHSGSTWIKASRGIYYPLKVSEYFITNHIDKHEIDKVEWFSISQLHTLNLNCDIDYMKQNLLTYYNRSKKNKYSVFNH